MFIAGAETPSRVQSPSSRDGMGEHAARYRRFAEALVDAGFVVYANDHRGHGVTAGGIEHHGDLGVAGWQGLVDDIGTLTNRVRTDHPGKPLALFGHSMGSFALQQFLIERSSDVDAAILSGTSAIDVIGAGIDPDAEVDLSAFNEPFEPAPTEYEWLSRDRAEVDAYVADDACGFGINAAGARGMLEGTAVAGDPAEIAKVRSDLPIYVMSGDADPLAGGGELIELVAQRYRVTPASPTSLWPVTPMRATRSSTRPTATKSPPTSSRGSTEPWPDPQPPVDETFIRCQAQVRRRTCA